MSKLKFLTCSVFMSVFVVSVANAAGEQCGVNLFNPQILRSADFTVRATGGNIDNGYTATGNWKGTLENYLLKGPVFDFKPNVEYKVIYDIQCDDVNDGAYFIGLKGPNSSTIGPTNNQNEFLNVCEGHVGETVTVSYGGTGILGFGLGQVGQVDNEYDGEVIISNVMVIPSDTLVGVGEFVPYNPCIRVATTLYTSNAAGPVETRLNSVRDMIASLITKSQTNTTNIEALNNNKQTRPNPSLQDGTGVCANDKKCLLVKDNAGVNHWYEIEDCDENAFLADVGSSTSITIDNNTYASSYCSTGDSALGCNTGETAMVYQNGIVFVEGIRLNIAEDTGSVVSLPGGITGESDAYHGLCRVVGYRAKDDNGILQPRQNVNSNFWIVDDTRANGTGIGPTDTNCYRYLLDHNGTAVMPYYTTVSNTCSPAAPRARMCQRDTFLSRLIFEHAKKTDVGRVTSNGIQAGACAAGGGLANNTHCSNGSGNYSSWITEFGNNGGYVYGIGGYMSVPSGTEAGDIVDASGIAVHRVKLTGDNAVVCMVQGYKQDGEAEQTLALKKALVMQQAAYENLHDEPTLLCMEQNWGVNGGPTFAEPVGTNAENPVKTYFRTLAYYCPASNN